MTIDIFKELLSLGLSPIPIQWDPVTKLPISHQIAHGEITDKSINEQTLQEWFSEIEKANGIALKLFPPFFMVDFDLKNTEDKTVFDSWMQQVQASNENILSKVCIEKTRNGGYHVYCKYSAISHKQTLASSESGAEVISNYTGGLLSYCHPTPGYEIIHNDFIDIQDLTQDEYDTINAISMSFNKYETTFNIDDAKVIEYPTEYEDMALQFDNNCNEKLLEHLLNSMDLYEVKGKRYSKKEKHLAYLRKGSKAAYSAKVYFRTNKVLLFTSSIIGYPSFQTRSNEHDHSWILTPTRLVYYSCGASWITTIGTIKSLCNEFSIQIETIKPNEYKDIIKLDRLKFPYDIFPKQITDYISCHTTIQNDYMGAAIFSAVSTAIGNSRWLKAMEDYFVKPILYMAIVAPPGASKSPAMKKAFNVIEKFDDNMYKDYEVLLEDYKIKLAQHKKDKNSDEPVKPDFPQTLIKDSTIEMVVKILSQNKQGCAVYADELVGFLNRMNRYQGNDENQKWLEMWSGGTILLQRITRDENRVKDPFCNIVGGIQPGVLESLSKDQNEHNGFYHRFLFCYPEPQNKPGWQKISLPAHIEGHYEMLFANILELRVHDRKIIHLSHKAEIIYKTWFDARCVKYNTNDDPNVKGIIAKYQDYCLRFALIIEVMNSIYSHEVSESSMEKAVRLTEYFFANIHKAMKLLAPETPADKLPDHWGKVYSEMPVMFTLKNVYPIADKYKIKEGAVRGFIHRNEGKLFKSLGKSQYEKIY